MDAGDLEKRMESVEKKVDYLIAKFEQAAGAWFFVKIMGAFAVGLVALWAFITDHINFH